MMSLTALLLFSQLSFSNACDPTNGAIKTYQKLSDYLRNEPNEVPGQQVLMNEQATKYGALCLDASVPDFYYRAGTDDGITKFHIYLEGGGWCQNMQACVQRTTTRLGSSKFDATYMNIAAGAPYLSSNASINPLTHNWNSIYIRYCDGTSYASDNQTVYQYNSSVSLHFRGWRILNGVLNTLVEQYNLSDATDVLFSGCSAGGLGVFFHADYVNEFISKLKNNARFNYMAMPDAGYFMQVSRYIDIMQFIYAYGNLSIGLNRDCVSFYAQNNMHITECMYAVNIAPFVKVKMFSMQSQYDSNQDASIHTNQTAQINEYGQNLTYWYLDRYINTSSNHYGFLVSCYQHCNFNLSTWNNITIDGYDVSEAQVNAWFHNVTYGQLLFQNHTYPCNACC